MKTRPILFSAPMVLAILAGRKTQTRRVITPRPAPHDFGPGGVVDALHPRHLVKSFEAIGAAVANGAMAYVRCPYGVPGDRLWVRETHGWVVGAGRRLVYAADGPPQDRFRGTPIEDMKWAPSIFMPRAASRITLEISTVRVQPLQEISEQDARAEGVSEITFTPDDGFPPSLGYMFGKDDGKTALQVTALEVFAVGWDSINGKRAPWASNPWVWAITFTRVS